MEPRTKTPPEETPAASAEDPPQGSPPFWLTRRFRMMALLVAAAVVVGLLIKNQLPAWMGGWNATSALQHRLEGKLDDALADCNRALEWLPEDGRLYKMRAEIQRERGELKAALADCDKLLAINEEYPHGYLLQCSIYQLLGQHDQAIAAAAKANQWWDAEIPEGLNYLAYARAVAGKDLEAALADANKALKLLHRDKKKKVKPNKDGGEKAKLSSTQLEGAYASYLDTRGFVHYRLGKNTKALADFDEAIKVFTRLCDELAKRVKKSGDSERLQLRYQQKNSNASLGLMHHHRGLVHEKLKQPDQAKADKEKAKKLGYDAKRHGV